MSPSCQPPPAEGVYALLTDGTTVLIRPATPEDAGAVRQMHEQMSPDNIYLRFFSPEQDVRRQGGTEGHQTAGSGSRGAAGLARRPACRGGELRAGRGSRRRRDRVRGERRHARPGRRDAAARSPRLDRAAARASAPSPPRRWLATMPCCGSSPRSGCRRGAGCRQGIVETTFPLPAQDASQQLQDYLDTVAASREPRRRGQLAAAAAARVRGCRRRQPRSGQGGPRDPAQHQDGRVRRPPLRCQSGGGLGGRGQRGRIGR